MIDRDVAIVADLVAAIYRSAYAPSEWPETIERLRLALNGARACLVRIGLDMRPDDVLATASDPDFDRAFATDTRLHSNAFSRTVDRMPLGTVVRHEEIWDADTLHRSPLWNEYLSPQEIHSGLMAKTLATDSSYWFFGVSRSQRQETFSESERTLMGVLSPHFRRATEIGRALEMERRSFDTRRWIGGTVGLVTVNSTRQMFATDTTADVILSRSGCALRRRAGRLEVRGCNAARFVLLVQQACRTGGDPTVAGGGEMVARADPDVDGSVDVLLSIGPILDCDRVTSFTEPSAMIAMRELSPALPTGFAATAAEALDLTPKEARISALLAAGHSLQEAAVVERISIHTARTHLRQLFYKTPFHNARASRLTRIMAAARTKKASAEEDVAS